MQRDRLMENEAYRRGRVLVRGEEAGMIEETDRGYRFRYFSDYLHGNNPLAVSITLPIREEPYESPVLFPFFDGLIPEGWLLQVVVRNWKLNSKDRFGLLLCACHDCIGDVQIEAEVDA